MEELRDECKERGKVRYLSLSKEELIKMLNQGIYLIFRVSEGCPLIPANKPQQPDFAMLVILAGPIPNSYGESALLTPSFRKDETPNPRARRI